MNIFRVESSKNAVQSEEIISKKYIDILIINLANPKECPSRIYVSPMRFSSLCCGFVIGLESVNTSKILLEPSRLLRFFIILHRTNHHFITKAATSEMLQSSQFQGLWSTKKLGKNSRVYEMKKRKSSLEFRYWHSLLKFPKSHLHVRKFWKLITTPRIFFQFPKLNFCTLK